MSTTTEKVTHTPGPWVEDADTIIKFLGEDANGIHVQAICEISYPNDRDASTKEAEANAYLIAAAPELLEALEFAKEVISEYAHRHIVPVGKLLACSGRIEAAIRKAKGDL